MRLLCSSASADASAARSTASVMRYSSSFCADRAPLSAASFERLRSAWACSRLARAWATAASCLRRSAVAVASASRASTCPRLTVLPTSASSSVMRRLPVSAPMTASCHAVVVPLASMVSGQSRRLGSVRLTASAAGGTCVSACAGAVGASRHRAMPATARKAANAAMRRFSFTVSFLVRAERRPEGWHEGARPRRVRPASRRPALCRARSSRGRGPAAAR